MTPSSLFLFRKAQMRVISYNSLGNITQPLIEKNTPHAVLLSRNSSNRSIACLPSTTVRDSRMNVSRSSSIQRKTHAFASASRAISMSFFARFHACAASSSAASSADCKAASDQSITCSGLGSEFKEASRDLRYGGGFSVHMNGM
jgi:hypothetical protein